jgi:hypothetical protein
MKISFDRKLNILHIHDNDVILYRYVYELILQSLGARLIMIFNKIISLMSVSIVSLIKEDYFCTDCTLHE